MNRKDYIDKIAKYLARFVEEVKSYNDMNLYDINIHSENALIPKEREARLKSVPMEQGKKAVK